MNEIPYDQTSKEIVGKMGKDPHTVPPSEVVFRKAGENVEAGRMEDQLPRRCVFRHDRVKIEVNHLEVREIRWDRRSQPFALMRKITRGICSKLGSQ